MKIKIIIASLLSLFCLIGFSQEPSSITIDLLEENILISEDPSEKVTEDTKVIDSLRNENSVLKNLLVESQNIVELKNREINTLRSSINSLKEKELKALEDQNDLLQRKLINIASNFLYIPYEEYSIEEIAIPAFVATKGYSIYSRYENRLNLLKSYKEDIKSLINILIQAEKDFSIPLAAMREKKAKEYSALLLSSSICKDYMSYDDWKNTYLGSQIVTIQKFLNSPTDQTEDQIKAIRKKLEALLNN